MSDIDEHKMVLELLAGRRSGMTSRTEQRDAAAAILDALEQAAADLARAREVIEKTEDWVTAHYLDTHMGEKVLELLANHDRATDD